MEDKNTLTTPVEKNKSHSNSVNFDLLNMDSNSYENIVRLTTTFADLLEQEKVRHIRPLVFHEVASKIWKPWSNRDDENLISSADIPTEFRQYLDTIESMTFDELVDADLLGKFNGNSFEVRYELKKDRDATIDWLKSLPLFYKNPSQRLIKFFKKN